MCGIKKHERNWRNSEVLSINEIGGDNVHLLAPSGGKAEYPPYGGFQGHPLWGWIFYFSAFAWHPCIVCICYPLM